MKVHALCVFVFAIASASNIEDRLSRLEATVQTLSDALKSLTSSSSHSKPLVEHTPIEHAPVEQDALAVHRRQLGTPSAKPCARFRNFHGNDVHGNHYLNTVWGSKTFDSFSASGNQCGSIKGMIGVKFRVLDSNGKLIFETGNIPLQENLFTSKHAITYERHGSDSTGYFSMNTCKGACKHYVYGNKCEQRSGNGHNQRSAFCVSDGKSTYQSILGGLNDDGYSVKHGPCMCDLKSMCGSCTSKNVIEMYPILPPKLSGPLPCARLRNFHGDDISGNHYLNTIWGDKTFESYGASGNQCGLVKGLIAIKFRVKDGLGKVIFETGEISTPKNFFTSEHAQAYERHGSDSTGYFSMSTCKDKCDHYVYGNKCETKKGNGHKQRTAFCVSDGKSTYQSILGGLNDDGYSVKHGPCMCDLKSMCGSCTSKNSVEIYAILPPPIKLSGPLPCARLRNFHGDDISGNHYLNTIWGDKTFGTYQTSGNQCGLVKGLIGVKFRVKDSNGKVIFETGEISTPKNFFTSEHAQAYERHGSDSTGYFSMSTCKDKCDHYVYGNKCETKKGNGHKQRTAFCVSDGKSTYQSILGGLNDDGYSVKHGPCMCDLKSMCGSCTSKNSVEIYPVFKPWEPTKLALDKYHGVRIARDESIVSFGAAGDVLFARTGEGKLTVQAKHIDFESAVTVKGSPIGQGNGNGGGGGNSPGLGSEVIDSLEASIKDIQKELGILSKAVAENTQNGLCNKKRDILVGLMPKGSTAHQKSAAVKGVKLSDTEINTIRGNFKTSVFKVTCGKCTAYVKQDRAFAAKGYTNAKTKLSMCSTSPDGPFKDYGYSGHNVHFGIDCWNLPSLKAIVYEDNNGGGCNCKGEGRTSGTLTVMNARYCEDVKL